MGGPRLGKQIAPWNGPTENRSALNPASIDGEFVDGKPVDYPEGVTWKTFNKEKADPGTMDTTPTDDQNKTSSYTGQDQKSSAGQAAQPVPNKEGDELAKDIETATKLLSKAEGSSSAIKGAGYDPSKVQYAYSGGKANPMKESIFRSLVESFGYVAEGLTDLSAEEQKQLTDVMSKLGPMTTGRPDIQTLVDRYMALQKGGEPSKEPSKEPEKTPEPSAEIPSEDPLLGPEELKTAVARFKELLDKSLMREPAGAAPMPDKPKPKPKKKPQNSYWGQGNSPGNITPGGSMLGPQHTDQAGAGSLG
jgi:hypothetical protein